MARAVGRIWRKRCVLLVALATGLATLDAAGEPPFDARPTVVQALELNDLAFAGLDEFEDCPELPCPFPADSSNPGESEGDQRDTTADDPSYPSSALARGTLRPTGLAALARDLACWMTWTPQAHPLLVPATASLGTDVIGVLGRRQC